MRGNPDWLDGDSLLARFRVVPEHLGFFDIAADDAAWGPWLATTQSGPREPIIAAIRGLSIAYRQNGDIAAARKWADICLRLAQSFPEDFGPRQGRLGFGRDRYIADALWEVAEVERVQGSAERAHYMLLEAKHHYDAEIEAREREGVTALPTDTLIANAGADTGSVRASLYQDLVESARHLGLGDQARRYFDLWQESRGQSPVDHDQISELVRAANDYASEGQPDTALRYLRQAVDLADTANPDRTSVTRSACHAYQSTARVYASLGTPRSALAMLEKAKALIDAQAGPTLRASIEVDTARILRDFPFLGDPLPHLLQALEYHSVPAGAADGRSWHGLDGTLMRVVDLDAAWPILLETAGILEGHRRLAESTAFLRLATSIAEHVRNGAFDETSRMAVQEQRSDAYLRLARIQLHNVQETPGTDSDFDNAWLTLEELRARTFLDAMGDHDLTPPSGVSPRLARREADLLDRRRKLRLSPTRDAGFWDEQQSVNRDLASTWESMAAESSAAARYVTIREARPAPPAEIARLLEERPASSAVVVNMLFPDDEHLVMLAVASGDHHVRAVSSPVDRKRLTQFVGEYFGATARVRYLATDLENSFHREFSGVVGPLADLCDPGQTLVICPAAPLHHVPLGAVRVGPDVLLERNPLVMSPSASLLRSRRPAAQESQEPLYAVFGDPTGDLPAAWTEACDLAKRWNVTPHLGEAATKEAFIDALRTSRGVHVAAHAWFDDSQPLQSGVRMANGTASAHEILQVRAPGLDLVSMSACETGLSQAGRSEDPVGLSRALIFAGVNSVVTTLWRVPSGAARDVMTKFHENLSIGQSKAGALRTAALATRSQTDNERFHRWAAFILTGAWD